VVDGGVKAGLREEKREKEKKKQRKYVKKKERWTGETTTHERA